MKNTKASLRYARAIFDIAKSQSVANQLFVDFNIIRDLINKKKRIISFNK